MQGQLRARRATRSRSCSWITLVFFTTLLCSAKCDGDGAGALFNAMATSYTSFYDELRKMAQVGSVYRGHVVMAVVPQDHRKVPPTAWLNVTVIGDGAYRAKMMLRNDNLYLMAFLNRKGQLFFMKGYGHLFQGLGGIELGFGEAYPDIMGQGGANLLRGLELGRAAASWASMVMSEYDPETVPEAHIKRAVAIMLVMGPEALRSREVRAVFADTLGVPTHLEQEHVDQIRNWGPISIGFFCDKQEKTCMTTAINDALKLISLDNQPDRLDQILDVMLRPRYMALDGRYTRFESTKNKKKKTIIQWFRSFIM